MNDRFDFDGLARDVARGLSRREALRRLGLGLGAGLLTKLTGWLPIWPTTKAEAATAAPSGIACFPKIVAKGSLVSWLSFSGILEGCLFCQTSEICCGGVCCAGSGCCHDVCASLQSDSKNCGACGNACLQNYVCCGGVCANTQSENSHCGACSAVCPAGDICCGGQCITVVFSTSGLKRICCNGSACTGVSPTCCGNACVDLATDPKNCGACGVGCPSGVCHGGLCTCETTSLACPAGQLCAVGLGCVAICPTAWTNCGGYCADLESAIPDCGACGHSCCPASPPCNPPPGETCIEKECIAQCCNGVCSDPETDSRNCGACGNTCLQDYVCCAGVCTDLQSNTHNCGACGHGCPVGESCVKGVCICGSSGSGCASGRTCCSGACVDLQSDAFNCSQCGQKCFFGTRLGACCAGVCKDTQTDPSNCGACGHGCANGGPCCAGICCASSLFNCIEGLCVRSP